MMAFDDGKQRQRELPNPKVTDDDYKTACKDWLQSTSSKSNAALGTNICAATWMGTPSSLVQMSGLIDRLIKVGCSNAVIFPTRSTYAVRQTLLPDMVTKGLCCDVVDSPHIFEKGQTYSSWRSGPSSRNTKTTLLNALLGLEGLEFAWLGFRI